MEKVKLKNPSWIPINGRILMEEVKEFPNLSEKGLIKNINETVNLIAVAVCESVKTVKKGDEIRPYTTVVPNEDKKTYRVEYPKFPPCYDPITKKTYYVIHDTEIHLVRKPDFEVTFE